MRTILSLALAIGAAAVIMAGAGPSKVRAEPAAASPLVLGSAELETVVGGIGDVGRSLNDNSIQDMNNGAITLGDATVTVQGDNRGIVYNGNQATSILPISLAVNNLIADAIGAAASEALP